MQPEKNVGADLDLSLFDALMVFLKNIFENYPVYKELYSPVP